MATQNVNILPLIQLNRDIANQWDLILVHIAICSQHNN
jgi:hypothetical protein